MGSRLQELRTRAAARDKVIDRAKVERKIQNPVAKHMSVEQMEQKIQMLEAYQQGVKAGNLQVGGDFQKLVIPQANGQMLSAPASVMEQRKQAITPDVMADKRWFEKELANEPYEEVTNFLDEDYPGVLNMVGYIVPARSTKKLPRTLAAAFRHKMSLLDRNEAFDKRTGAYDGPGTAPAIGFNHFRREVLAFDRTEDDIEPGNRVQYF